MNQITPGWSRRRSAGHSNVNVGRRSRRKQILGIFSVLLALMLLVACGSRSAANENELVVGHLAHLTGADAGPYGLPYRNGLDMGVEAVNASGVLGDVELVVNTKDVGSEVPSAVTQYSQFRNEDISVFVSPSSTPIRMALQPYVESDDVMLFSSTVGSKDAEAVRGVYVLNDGSTPDTNFGMRLGGQQQTNRAVVVTDGDNPAFKSLATSFKTGYEEAGGQIADQVSISASDSDFAPVVTKIRASRPNLVLISSLSETAGNLITQMAQSGGFDDVLFAGVTSWQKQVFQTAGPAATGSEYAVYWAADPEGDFEKSFTAKYGETPNSFAASGYQAAWLIAAAASLATENGDPLDGKTLSEYMPEVAKTDIIAQHGIYPEWQLRENGTASFAGAAVEFASDGTSDVVK
ncbi:hypothetical protein CJ179_47060 [Rhodococcus sp. ACS1]|uniref:ABC transporter substrate-binding protein n=1 Tax=Rhodococcus sp. ACS1 TaxID=2028570 RepID=UPI000BB15EE6|nr:ABC transporter substrate-binding protein [Rhodococcus sp. ACS1]PBC35622.1 hypothetical protein CJ179_47060 [Rhodococcus sp. ACS1]